MAKRQKAPQPSRPPLNPRDAARRRTLRIRRRINDVALTFAGLGLAVGAAYFPWHVYLNPDNYGPPKMQFTGRNDAVGETEDRLVARWKEPRDVVEERVLDDIVTGTATRAVGTPAEDIANQPFPDGKAPYTVLYVVNGRALIRDGNDLFMVGRKSRLPDGTTVEAIRSTGDGWQVVTSESRVLTLSNGSR